MDRKTETKIIKDALKKAGIDAKIRHGKGTAWGWIDIFIGDPKKRNGLHPAPRDNQYTDDEIEFQNRIVRLVQKVTGRHGEYDGNICVLAQE